MYWRQWCPLEKKKKSWADTEHGLRISRGNRDAWKPMRRHGIWYNWGEAGQGLSSLTDLALTSTWCVPARSFTTSDLPCFAAQCNAVCQRGNRGVNLHTFPFPFFFLQLVWKNKNPSFIYPSGLLLDRTRTHWTINVFLCSSILLCWWDPKLWMKLKNKHWSNCPPVYVVYYEKIYILVLRRAS